MTVKDLINSGLFHVLNQGESPNRMISKLFCCDLLSMAMGKAPQGCVWVTVMGNINTIAVAVLAEAACVILAEGVTLDEAALKKALQESVTVLRTDWPVFEAALLVDQMIHDEA